MGDILVGTCSWTDKALVSSGWYPPGRRDAEGRLRHYAERFPVVEVDSTYYGLPRPRNSELWVERTPPGFLFDVKAFSLLTGHPTRPEAVPADLRPALLREAGLRGGARPWGRRVADGALLDEVWARFAEALLPLRSAGRLGSVLFQFPPWFRAETATEAFLEQCRERARGWPVAVEFRHPSWWQEDRRERTCALLRGLGVAAVAVDMAQTLSVSIPPVAPVTAEELALVRFHGRSAAWGTGSKEDRFRHAYTAGELAAWVPRLCRMAERAGQVHVLFNNCCGDAAVRAAECMEHMLAGRTAVR
ncbi:DUF72 domain-containing protein [Streptomyces sp. NRRL S-118]|uniref:DUF72 domain-containing protein n=1 Tax=Streptomyces sp. NRRL S-118 TaxID=1463881 RepID=UPI000588064C|nr:DUF72 domain-containing protein [Streptomyces sp. NRRL S-118]